MKKIIMKKLFSLFIALVSFQLSERVFTAPCFCLWSHYCVSQSYCESGADSERKSEIILSC